MTIVDPSVPQIGPRGPHGGLSLPRAGESIADDELIGTWQLFRRSVSGVDAALAAAMPAPAQSGVFYEALATLAASPERALPMTELASAIAVSTGGLTKLVDRLVHAGFVDRRHSAYDRRVVYASLTDAGAAYERRVTPVYAELLRAYFGPLRRDGVVALRSICRQLESRAATDAGSGAGTVARWMRHRG